MTHSKQIQVTPYNPAWPKIYEVEAVKIKQTLGDNFIAIHHVGSTSVPGLRAKPIIDMIAVVKNLTNTIKILKSASFEYRGEWNIPFKYCFTKRGEVDINLHVHERGHPEIELNLLFRDYLRQNLDALEEYALLKQNLLLDTASSQKTISMFSGYTLGKDSFIRKVLQETGFNRVRLVKCAHYLEWEAYHRIKEQQIFAPLNVIYDRNHPHLTAEHHYHFILCKGLEIVSVGQVEFLNTKEAAISALATDEPYKKQGFGKAMMNLLEKWIKFHGRDVIKMHSTLTAEDFYRKLGYINMTFDDPSLSDEVASLGKKLRY